jgi:hypothetical protein
MCTARAHKDSIVLCGVATYHGQERRSEEEEPPQIHSRVSKVSEYYISFYYL